MKKEQPDTLFNKEISFDEFKREVLNDYRTVNEIRQVSLPGRKEEQTGKASSYTFVEGTEVAQLAMAKQFRNGDFHTGYYHDHSFFIAAGLLTVQELFSQLYTQKDVDANPSPAERHTNTLFGTRLLDPDGSWKDITKMKNSSAVPPSTGSLMPRLLGLAHASKIYKGNKDLYHLKQLSDHGNEVAFGTTGITETYRGLFPEAFNAACTLQVPLALSILDYEYGLPVTSKYPGTNDGYEIFKVKGWDYPALCEVYEKAVKLVRSNQIPVLIHIVEITQPQSHSSSNRDKKYKSIERTLSEKNIDCLGKMREWILATAIATEKELDKIEEDAKKHVIDAPKAALKGVTQPIKDEINEVSTMFDEIASQNNNEVKPTYNQNAEMVDGRVILRDNFDAILAQKPEVLVIGKDVGQTGGVNQGLEGLQAKYGELRVFDTGISEATLVGQATGLALRGLRPVVDIQDIDCLLNAIHIMRNDLATLHKRTNSGQKAPVIIRIRGGIRHSGSHIGMIISALRGIYVCVPGNMTQAAGFYNTLLTSDAPGLIIESSNDYNLKEKMPSNPGEFKPPLGAPEILNEGTDITLVTYGSMCKIAVDAVQQLSEVNISVELIDVQTLLPFDIHHKVVESLKKTNRIVFIDEDVPGGATAYMMQKVIEEQGGYNYLDSKPKTLSARELHPAQCTDGNYFRKPSVEDIFDVVYELMNEANPGKYPEIY
ncbi:MAG: transketolase C-terminal domain-containing protein [Bacteroidota bacterium]